MTRTYSPREYHNRPLCTIELKDGTTWRIRYPKTADLDVITDLHEAQKNRFRAHVEDLRDRAEAARLEAEEAGEEDSDAAARALIDAQPDLDPDDVRHEYLVSEVLAAFITPEVTPAEVLSRIGNEYDLDFLYERHEELLQTLTGDAAKKRLRGQ